MAVSGAQVRLVGPTYYISGLEGSSTKWTPSSLLACQSFLGDSSDFLLVYILSYFLSRPSTFQSDNVLFCTGIALICRVGDLTPRHVGSMSSLVPWCFSSSHIARVWWCGEVWGGVGRCGEVWGGVEWCGEVWGGVGRCGEVWDGVSLIPQYRYQSQWMCVPKCLPDHQ